MITLSHLHKFFNKGKQNEIHVINDISLTLPEKGIVAIFGRSGCGKTTLLNVIGGLDNYHSGTVCEDQREIGEKMDVYRNRDIGYIFQNYNLLKDESCYDNVANALRLCGMTDKNEIKARVDTALSFVDMAQYARRTPDTLSGGQQQRVAIARAIVKNPRIILADEPTGNLDEINTVMVMDLLREIARDCLVILVTHEAELVDYYCDTVIELSDGKVVGVRDNHITDGYAARDKNTIYLGELEKDTLKSDAVTLSYYGQKPDAPIGIRVVSYGGKTYLAVDSPDIQLLDKDSEMKLEEGVFERREERRKKENRVDMSRLPRIEGGHFGRLFSMKSAIASGYRANFAKQKKGKKLLRGCLALFAAVIVFMTAIFSTSIGRLSEIRSSFNPNVFYALTDAELSAVLNDTALARENGIDALYVRRGYVSSDEFLYFGTGFFETFENGMYDSGFKTHGVFLPSSLAKDMPLLAGKRTLGEGDMLLSSASADILIESSTLGYIKAYDDLIGLSATNYGFLGNQVRIAGVVESKESAFYLDDGFLAEGLLRYRSMNVISASEAGISVDAGKVVYMADRNQATDAYTVGKSVMIAGESFTISDSVLSGNYEDFLAGKGIKKPWLDEYLKTRMEEEYPTLSDYDPEYGELYEELRNKEEPLWTLEYYSEILDYCRLQYFFMPSFEAWLYVEKDISLPYIVGVSHQLFMILKYQSENGRIPTLKELEAYDPGDYKADYESYQPEYEKDEHDWRSTVFVMHDDEYLALVSRVGKSDGAIDPYAEESEKYDNYYNANFTVIHSSDPEKTAAFLAEHKLTAEDDIETLITPEVQFDMAFFGERIAIITGFVTMAVILGVMSICMYFIMRSALMNRIREIGIFRAIGVSKKNLVFRFMVESALLVALTVFVGYLVSSGFIWLCLSASSLVADIFFYPVWMAGAVLLVLVLISMVCGLVPIVSLLRKTPSAIIAKYDI